MQSSEAEPDSRLRQEIAAMEAAFDRISASMQQMISMLTVLMERDRARRDSKRDSDRESRPESDD